MNVYCYNIILDTSAYVCNIVIYIHDMSAYHHTVI